MRFHHDECDSTITRGEVTDRPLTQHHLLSGVEGKFPTTSKARAARRGMARIRSAGMDLPAGAAEPTGRMNSQVSPDPAANRCISLRTDFHYQRR